ncbi:MAG: hypothetical protein N3A66_10540, partial [Planctomycetota bacterium]|nr:hypothetical protein [Planctomycetota bacterium]
MDFAFLDTLKFDADGLIPCVAQDVESGEVLMVAYMNRESLRDTLSRGLCAYWSRSRQRYWVKGETSGHTQEVREVRFDKVGVFTYSPEVGTPAFDLPGRVSEAEMGERYDRLMRLQP